MAAYYSDPTQRDLQNILRNIGGPPSAPSAYSLPGAAPTVMTSSVNIPGKSPCSAPITEILFRVLSPTDARNWLMAVIIFVAIWMLYSDSRDEATKKDEAGQLVNSHVIWILKLAAVGYAVVSFIVHCRYA